MAKRELELLQPVPNKAKDLAYYKALMDRYFGSNHALSKESSLLRLKRSMSAVMGGASSYPSALVMSPLSASSASNAGVAGTGSISLGLLAARKQQHQAVFPDMARQSSAVGLTRPGPKKVLATTTFMLDDSHMQGGDDLRMFNAMGMDSKRISTEPPQFQQGERGSLQPSDVSSAS